MQPMRLVHNISQATARIVISTLKIDKTYNSITVLIYMFIYNYGSLCVTEEFKLNLWLGIRTNLCSFVKML